MTETKNLRQRQALERAYSALLAAEAQTQLLGYGVEEAVADAIANINGADTSKRPNALNKAAATVQNLRESARQLRESGSDKDPRPGINDD